MRHKLLLASLVVGSLAGFLLPSSVRAGEAAQVATRGGFLLGQAFRCGASIDALVKPSRVIKQGIAALAEDAAEKKAADQAFADRLLMTMVVPATNGALPSCSLVKRELARLSGHQWPIPDAAVAADTSSPAGGSAAMTPVHSRWQASPKARH